MSDDNKGAEVEVKAEENKETPQKTVEINLTGFPKYQGPTSTIITTYSPGDLLNKWKDSAILIPHEGLRLMHQILREILHADDLSKTPWKLVVLAKMWDEWYWPVLHHHHHSEEEIYFPALKKRVEKLPGTFACLLEKGKRLNSKGIH
ncbi:hypothetical protein RFI_25629 [Reticulomyxa filosa]|uniref:Hemerythrin-like domain-containing protein n=1 Tax=Reticulomyxa filosa TaxID=46433 RepID=X6MDK8_RETFI|nr:hypothetical protein RFI_25629 [Reticulomyxa filosa]|eukprot:ETO11751.1 hypothetical protein RFI_25629 [Reticulomyxa filosa]